ncbi:SRPBCC family protein [Flavobacterium sp. NG2]|uniref:SRPBCC family protein n=1 Tax=Flavobacterium sp. NG2 TaxID=3097547 RepID=UPI002A831D21|nr:SRPBCC family protein [Flavobacterium sp. NG2]WPR70715.1 SRPBCC family protein [Flavobacterium sp. NG2]
MSTQTVTLHRVIKATPEKVYRAFTNPTAYASWIPPYGFLCLIHEIEVKVGGQFKMSFENFTTGKRHSFGGKFVAIEPNAFIKYAEQFDDPNLPGLMTTSVWLNPVSVGTELKIIQENIPVAIPVEMCYLGWQESIEKLIRLVEPDIPDA